MEVAGGLARQAGLPEPTTLTRLAGGKNNRVFTAELEGGGRAILKVYHRSARDMRDRLGSEWEFLRYAASRKITSTPAPLAIDRAAGAALYSFMRGRKLDAAEVTATHVSQALDFIVELNAGPRVDARLAPGSEACVSITEHVATIDRRMERLGSLDSEAPFRDEAEALVRDRLRPLWAALRARVLAEFPSPERCLGPGRTIVSPSDFGFHNALVSEGGRLGFLDFEYAGIDDPAKLAGDFFSVPEIPVPKEHFELFIGSLASRLDLGPEFGERAAKLLPVYNLKWICIILNDFLAPGAERRAFALDQDRSRRCQAQLAKARAKLSAFPIEP